MNSSRNIHQFFERDIIEFLDEKARKSGKLAKTTEDKYYVDLRDQKFDDACAKLEILVKDFNKLLKGDVHKDIIYDQINRCVEQGKKYLNYYSWDNELGIIISKLEDNQELTDKQPEKILSFDYRRQELNEKAAELSSIKETKRQELESSIQKKESEISAFVNKKDLKSAIVNYKELKLLYKKYPENYEREKKQIYNNILAYYFQIKKLQENLRKEAYLKNNNKNKMTDKQGNETLSVQDILAKINTIKKNSREARFTLARNELVSLKYIVDNISNDYSHARDILSSKIEIIQKNLDYAKKVYNEQGR